MQIKVMIVFVPWNSHADQGHDSVCAMEQPCRSRQGGDEGHIVLVQAAAYLELVLAGKEKAKPTDRTHAKMVVSCSQGAALPDELNMVNRGHKLAGRVEMSRLVGDLHDRLVG